MDQPPRELGRLTRFRGAFLGVTAEPQDHHHGRPGHDPDHGYGFPVRGRSPTHQRHGPKGLSAGDLILTTGMPILDNASGQRVGTSDAVELIVSKRHDAPWSTRAPCGCPGATSTPTAWSATPTRPSAPR